MNRHERAYSQLLSLYPVSFRDRYEEEMVTLFIDQLWAARASGTKTPIAWLWLRSLGDVVSTAPDQRFWKQEELVPRPLDSDAVALAAAPRRRGVSKADYAVALLPLWVGILLGVLAPGYMDGLFLNPPSVSGLPAGIVITFVAGLLMAMGVLVIRWTSSPVGRGAAFLLLTVPSFLVVAITPAIILIIVTLNV